MSDVQFSAVPKVQPSEVDGFRSALRGQLIMQGEADYEEARKVYNGMIDKWPAFIVRCAGVDDVIAAVNFAREQKLLLAVRGGGHNGGGLGTCDDGLVIDLSGMRDVQVDPEARTAQRARWLYPGRCRPCYA